jgi:putative ABC transport system substrate-binding protein
LTAASRPGRVVRKTSLRAIVTGSLALTLVFLPRGGETQQGANIARIGYLSPSSASEPRGQRFLGAFRQGLRELGYVEGRSIVIEYRWADGKYDRLPGLAAELVGRKVSVIVTYGAGVQAAQVTGIPIVMAVAQDPVAAGFVASLARPGGNITGLSSMAPELVGKQLELVKEVIPKVARVALLGNPANTAHAPQLRHAQDTARVLGLRLQPMEARDPSELDNAFAAMTRERAGAVVVFADSMLLDHRTRIAELAAQRRLPTLSTLIDHVEVGGLLAYGPSISDMFRRASTYVDKILKGAKPADLPVEQPTRFELVINLRAAKALKLTIPPSVLARANQVIQ